MFLQYILKQDKHSMVYNILKVTNENPTKNDFVYTCRKYMEILKINVTFEELEKMSKIQLRNILHKKIKYEALMYLKNQQLKQEKIRNVVYSELKMQDYLQEGDRNTAVSKVIFKARGQTLDIKMQKRWKYDDIKCEGCHENSETGQEILQCKNLGENENLVDYTWFFSESMSKQISAGKLMIRKLKKRKMIRDAVT